VNVKNLNLKSGELDPKELFAISSLPIISHVDAKVNLLIAPKIIVKNETKKKKEKQTNNKQTNKYTNKHNK